MDNPTKKPIAARVNMHIGVELDPGKFYLSTGAAELHTFNHEDVPNEEIPFELDVVYASSIEDLREKLHRMVNQNIDAYIDFLHGN